MNVLVGIIVGVALTYCLIMPHIRSQLASEKNASFKSYSEEQAANESSTSSLKNQNQLLTEQVEELQSQLEELQGGSSSDGTTLLDMYDSLFTALKAYLNDNSEKAASTLLEVDRDSLSSEKAQELFDTISEATFESASVSYFEQGRDAYNGQGEFSSGHDYDKAIELLETSLEYNADNTDAMYFLGRCYQQMSQPDKAKEYYNQIIDDYPDSARVSEASSRLRELGE